MLDYSFFYDIAVYGNKNWKGNFTPKEIACNAYDYLVEYEASKSKGEATETMQELIRLLIADGGDDVEYFLNEIYYESPWKFIQFTCEHCGKKEMFFFSETEMKNIEHRSYRQMLIQDALPDKPQWVREYFISGKILCSKCWAKVFGNGGEV